MGESRILSGAILASAILLAASIAFAAQGTGGGVIRGCYSAKSGKLRILKPGAKCHRGERPISWNATGPGGTPGGAGPGGPGGQQGPGGAKGDKGDKGDNGTSTGVTNLTQLNGIGCTRGSGGTAKNGTVQLSYTNTSAQPGDATLECVVSSPTCPDSLVEPGEECDNGANNSNSTPDACRTNCKEAKCGDTVTDTAHGETCDAGGANGNTPNAACRTNCKSRRCGDGIVDNAFGEVCDDGNTTSGDGCSASCNSLERCGNNIVDVHEACDDGNTANGDTCNSACTGS